MGILSIQLKKEKSLSIKKVLSKSEFGKNVLTLTSGSIVSQGITIGISPILTRVYSPEDFGVLSLYLSILLILSVISTGKYELAILLPKHDETAKRLLQLTVLVSFLFSLITLIVIILFNSEITKLLGNDEISNWLYFTPLSIALNGAYQAFNYYNNRHNEYKIMALASVAQSGTTGTLKVILGLFHASPGGLILSQMAGEVIRVITLSKNKWVPKALLLWSEDLSKDLKKVACDYVDHPKLLTFTSGVASIYQQIPVIFIGKYYSLEALGFFTFAHKLIHLPGALLSNSIGQVFRQRAAIDYNQDGCFDRILVKTVWTTFRLSIVPFLILYFTTEDLFALIFSEKWRIAGEYSKVLIIGSFFSFVITPIDQAALIVKKVNYIFYWETSRFFATLLTAVICYYFQFEIKTYLYSLVLVNCIFYIFDLFKQYSFSKKAKSS